MKKFFLTLICFSAVSCALAQDVTTPSKQKTVQFGLLGGLNVTNITNEEEGEDFSYRVAYRAGAFAKLNLSSSFYLNLKAFYSAQGNSYEQDLAVLTIGDPVGPNFSDSDSFEGKMILNYIQVPLTLEYRTGRFSFELGPQIGFNVAAKTVVDINGSEEEFDIDNEQSVVFGATFGVNAYITDSLFVSLAYDRGLTNLYRDVRMYISEESGYMEFSSKYKYSNFSLSLNYILF